MFQGSNIPTELCPNITIPDLNFNLTTMNRNHMHSSK